ncbi:hypothetical protein BGZ74_003303, partial [Mortierella antarctica]
LNIRYHENVLYKRHKSQPAPDGTYAVGHRSRDGDLHVVKKGSLTEDGTEDGTKLRLHELTVGPDIFQEVHFPTLGTPERNALLSRGGPE